MYSICQKQNVHVLVIIHYDSEDVSYVIIYLYPLNCQSLNEFELELKNLRNLHCTCFIVKAYFYDYFPVLLILLFTIFGRKFLWVSSEFKIGFPHLHI